MLTLACLYEFILTKDAMWLLTAYALANGASLIEHALLGMSIQPSYGLNYVLLEVYFFKAFSSNESIAMGAFHSLKISRLARVRCDSLCTIVLSGRRPLKILKQPYAGRWPCDRTAGTNGWTVSKLISKRTSHNLRLVMSIGNTFPDFIGSMFGCELDIFSFNSIKRTMKSVV